MTISFHQVMSAVAPILSFCALLLAGAMAWFTFRPRRGADKVLTLLLLLLAGAAAVNYYYCSYASHRSFVNYYEFYHYYMGAKYADEIGYEGLYNASIIADSDTGMKYNIASGDIRNLANNHWIQWREVLADRDRHTARFSPLRWEEFVHDIAFFKARLSRHSWNSVLTDKGYNGSPVWGVAAGILANTVGTGNPAGMNGLAALDAALLLIGLAAVWWAFGHRVALLTAIFLGTCFLMSHSHMKGALLRTDWVVALVLSLCALKKGHCKTAGCLSAWAALSRIFPAIFIFGIAAKVAFDFLAFLNHRLRKRPGAAQHLDRKRIEFLAAFAFTIGLGCIASLLYHNGVRVWFEYMDKITLHNAAIGTWRMGFKYLFLFAYESPGRLRDFQTLFDSRQVLWWSIQAVVLLLSAFGVRRLRDSTAFAFGFVPVFFLVAPTYYYFIMLLLPFLFFAGEFKRPAHAVGLLYLFAASLAAYGMYPFMGRGLPFFFLNSCLYLILALFMIVLGYIGTPPVRCPEDDRTQPATRPL